MAGTPALNKLPVKIITGRGWGLIIAGVAALLLAQLLGRRDLLTLGVFLVLLPLLAALALRLRQPQFTIRRGFRPPSVETGATTTVRLSVRRSGFLGGSMTMNEQLPLRFGRAPAFGFPSRAAARDGTSLYEYKLQSNCRGLYSIGPVLAEFTDPFGLSRYQHRLGLTDPLTVTPAPVPLTETRITGGRGTDGSSATRAQANPSNDDVMTREYRHGDPMRRVHWAATARAGELMVRQEESVAAPQASLLLDQRESSYSSSALSPLLESKEELLTSPNFEWAVTAVVSIAQHLIDRNYSLRLIDAYGNPGLQRSRSAPWPGETEFSGAGGLQNLAEGLAALELDGGTVKRASTSRMPFDDQLLDRLAAHRLRGPLLAVTGDLSPAEARALAAAAEFGSHAFAMLIVDHPAEAQPMLETLRAGGWRAVAVSSKSQLPAAWSFFDLEQAAPSSTAKTTIGQP